MSSAPQPLFEQTLTELVEQIHAKTITSTTVTQAFLSQAGQNATLNCLLSQRDESTLLSASAAASQQPLAGLPIAHKDLFCTTTLPTTCGSKMLEHFTSPFDAEIVLATESAGGLLFGKTNMDEFAMGSTSENQYFGSVLNPWDHSKVAGGSSGGSAAAVAARMVPLATASDTGGSIRQPAAFCGVTGFKPTYGSISRYGMVAYASSLDQAGPIAKTALDCAYYFDLVNRPDAKDSTCAIHPRTLTYPLVQAQVAKAKQPLKGQTFGYLPTWLAHEGLASGINQRFNDTKQWFESQGVSFVPLELPSLFYALAAYYILASAEASSNLARFDGVRYGYRCDQPANLEDLYKRTRQEGFGLEVKRRILTGTFVLSEGYIDAYYLQAQKIRRLVQNDFNNAFKQVDAILTPTTPTTALGLGQPDHDPVAIYLQDVFTIPANLAGLPAISFPVEPINGMPVGMQLMGQRWQDSKVLTIAHAYQQHTSWHQHSPLATQDQQLRSSSHGMG